MQNIIFPQKYRYRERATGTIFSNPFFFFHPKYIKKAKIN